MDKEQILNVIHYVQEHDADETEKYIYDSFESDQIEMINKKINQAYYESDTKYIIPNDMNLFIMIHKGDDDKFNNMASHRGTDIILEFPYDEKSFTLFYENQKEEIDMKQLNDLLSQNKNITKENALHYFKKYDCIFSLYNYLPDNIKNDSDIIDTVIDSLEKKAYLENLNQLDYANISPYGGLDIIVQSEQDIFLNELKNIDLIENKKLIDRAKERFCTIDFNKRYIKNEILNNKKMLYYFEHEEEYRKQYQMYIELSEKFSHVKHQIDKLENSMNTLKNDILNVNNQIKQKEDDINALSGSNHHIYEFTKKRLKKSQIENLFNELNDLKIKKQGYDSDLSLMEKNYNILIENKLSLEKIDKELETLSSKLKYKYDYLLNDSFKEIYHYMDNFDHSFNFMKAKEPEIKERLAYLKDLDIIAEKNYYTQFKNEKIDELGEVMNDLKNDEYEESEYTGKSH